NQEPLDTCVLNSDDAVLREFGRTLDCQVVYFSSRTTLQDGVYYEDGSIYKAAGGEAEKVIDTSELRILGVHNYENASAAIAICQAMGVSLDLIRKGLREFEAVPHRIQFICETNGIAFYNDSKGTNPDAAIKAVEAMERPTVLIGGGYDKDSVYDDWIKSFDGKVKKLILIGETREKIAACAKKHGFGAVEMAEDLKEAVEKAYESAVSGDAVLLSPACASWGSFKNYEERGDLFARYAREIK
ncbi:MAG: UDP-N-acetylmuramoyl-L-alanine--D-glutamate ligase, partial [Lachnospiraceae bacterium]|nr:UDP-N-acetylmuramoyl-L-alanine--D-glutamate ligase [Lachnospiraceae bacterium]